MLFFLLITIIIKPKDITLNILLNKIINLYYNMHILLLTYI